MKESKDCPCGSHRPYPACCGRYHARKAVAPTAEALMRSRYSAYVLGDAKYLYRSWDEATRPSLSSLRQLPPVHWLGLEILATRRGGTDDDEGIVEFIARYMEGGRIRELAERSRFHRSAGRWVYVDGNGTKA